jgi:integrase
MSRIINRLTARSIAAARPKPGKRVMLADGGNLLLQVTGKPDGSFSRSWIFRYERDGVRHDLGLGPLDTLSLAEARRRARDLRIQLLDGVDLRGIREQKRAERLEQLSQRARQMTFRECALRCIEGHEDSWRSAEHHRQWITSLEQYVYPLIGDLPVDEIATPHIVKVLEAIWKDKPETASRVRGRIERVLGWAQVRGFRSGDNPARWRGHLQELFPSRGKIQKTEHHSAMPFAEVPTFMVELRAHNSLTARALEYCILTATRSGEVLHAKWGEIDLAAKTWTIPAARMKAGNEHRVPLPARALEILAALPREGELLFPLTHTAMLELLRRMGHDSVTVHGFRSSFRDWASERTNFPEIVAEQALAHAVGSKVQRAYHRTDLYGKRKRLMADWAAWCARPVSIGCENVSFFQKRERSSPC